MLDLLPSAPQIVVSASPKDHWLVLARKRLAADPDAPAMFLGSRDLPDTLAMELTNYLIRADIPEEDAKEVGAYLAAEWAQLGPVLVHPQTGRALVALTPDMLYIPSPVLRESGHVVARPQDIKPGIKAAVTLYLFEEEREKTLVKDMTARVVQTELLVQEGDPRLVMVTSSGRRTIGQGLIGLDPWELLNTATGPYQQFLGILSKGGARQEDTALPFKVHALITENTSDARTFSLRSGPAYVRGIFLANKLISQLVDTLVCAHQTKGDILPGDVPLSGRLVTAGHASLYPFAGSLLVIDSPKVATCGGCSIKVDGLSLEGSRSFEIQGTWRVEMVLSGTLYYPADGWDVYDLVGVETPSIVC